MKTLSTMLLCDMYKLSHRLQYPQGTETVYSTWVPRATRIKGIDKVVSFGQQAFIKKYLIDFFNENFFSRDRQDVTSEYARIVKATLGTQNPDTKHIEELHDLGYLPLRIDSLAEGTLVPLRVPMMTIQNTDKRFFWLTNYIETLASCELWQASTSATLAYQYRKLFDRYATLTGAAKEFVPFMGHDFSMRGLSSVDSAISSGMGHLLSFVGTDTIPAIQAAEFYYGANVEKELVGCSIPATEHSVQSCYGNDFEYMRRMIQDVHPNGLVSIVSDGYDYWKMVTEVIPSLKEVILARKGGPVGDKVVVRPDCYSEDTQILTDSGFKFFKDLQKTDLVAQVLENGTQEFVKPLKYTEYDYTGEMYNFKDNKGKLDLLVTPDHRMFFKQNDELKMQLAKDAKVGIWKKDVLRTVPVKNLNKQLTSIEKLKIAFQADGSYQTGTNKIRFSFSKQRKIERLETILKSANINYKIYQLSDGRVEFNVDAPADSFRKDLEWVDTSSLCSNWSGQFIEELSYWDATRRSDTRFKFDTTIKTVIDKVELIAMSAGYGVLVSEVEDNRKEHFSNVFTAHIMKDNFLGGQSQSKTQVTYSGKVFCVQVPSGMIIVKRNRGTAVCGNSGDPVLIVCGDLNAPAGSPERKGTIELLWEIFGGTVNKEGYKGLNPAIGCIYGDAITLERAEKILEQLRAKGFASTNIVFGVGSFTYQFNTRDTFGFALKSTLAVINGDEKMIFKDPKTDDGTKKSLKGAVHVYRALGNILSVIDCLALNEKPEGCGTNLLTTIFENGKLMNETTFAEIRHRLANQ